MRSEFSEDPAVGEWAGVVRGGWTHTHANDGRVWAHLPGTPCNKGAAGVGEPGREDPISMPSHYTQLPVECIDVTEHFSFTLGNAIKYIWRADHKGKPLEDLRKARWYIDREIARRERG